MGDDVHCAHFSFKSSSNLNIFQSQRCFSSLLFLVEVQGDWRDFCIKKKQPKNHATLKDTHKIYLTNTGNTKGRGNCLKKIYKNTNNLKKKKILAAAIATTQSLNGCAYGTNLKILGDFLLELSHSKIFLKTSDLDVEITEIQTITLTNLGVHVARLPVAVMKIPHQPFTGEG